METTNFGKLAKFNPYHFNDVPQYIDYSDLPRHNGLLELSDGITRIIETAYPIHYDEICQHVAPNLGRKKVSSEVQRNVDFGLDRCKNNYIEIDDM